MSLDWFSLSLPQKRNKECYILLLLRFSNTNDDFFQDLAWGDHWDEAIGDKLELNPHIPKPDPPKEEEKKEEEKKDNKEEEKKEEEKEKVRTETE